MPFTLLKVVGQVLRWFPTLGVVIVGLAVWPAAGQDRAAEQPVPFRFAFSSRMFSEVNENDAKASLKAWARIVAAEREIYLAPAPLVLHGTLKLTESLQRDEADAIIMTCDEYLIVSQSVKLAPIFATAREAKFRAEYLVLVPADSDLKTLASMQGRSLLTTDLPEQCLALPWLDTALAREGLPASSEHFRILRKTRLSAAVLPVFFRTADACLVNRYAFETMVELNPQVGRQLCVVARSPQVVASLVCFRANYASAHREQLIAAMKHLHESPAGQQILALFQVSQLIELEEPELQTTRELWAEYTGLAGNRQPPRPVAASKPVADSPEP